MQSFLHDALMKDSGYFHIWISTADDVAFFSSDLDKAYFMTILQDNLSPRTRISELSMHSLGYADSIDLLAYSLTRRGVHLLVYTSQKSAIEELGQVLLLGYVEFIQDNPAFTALPFETVFLFDHLAGRHQALAVSRDIHMRHTDWRYDRYSSIGFYLDDRRGDWMRPRRLTSLFHNKPRQYLRFIKSQETERDRIFTFLANR